MIRELINFTNTLDLDFKNLGIKLREGLHILLDIDENQEVVVKEYSFYSKKMIEENDFFAKIKIFGVHSWCIDTGKCLDLPAKGIHSCSPFSVGFKMEFLEGGGKNSNNKEKNKAAINSRLEKYFEKAFDLIEDGPDLSRHQTFRNIFINKSASSYFEQIIEDISQNMNAIQDKITEQVSALEAAFKETVESLLKEKIKDEISELKLQNLQFRKLESSDYVIFYLEAPIAQYMETHTKYLSENLFLYKDKYITTVDENTRYGTSAFMNSFNGNMPFLMHQTAPFDISGKISNYDSKVLYDFEQILSRKILPKILPIFIFKEELQNKLVAIFKESGYKSGFKEIIEKLWDEHSSDFNNYYLLNWANTKDGLVFMDIDYVPLFQFEFKAKIQNLFGLYDQDNKEPFHYQEIQNVFDLEEKCFSALIQNKYRKLDYFNDLEKDAYEKLDNTFICYCKYRKAIYDYIYKSKWNGINQHMFYDMVFSRIKDDLKHERTYSIKDKLNIWFSLYERFKSNNNQITLSMASKLKSYQDFVAQLAIGNADLEIATDEHFAFAAGQVIEYVIQKSKSDNKSYQLLEPYLQQSRCAEFKKALANDIARYKHAINDNEFRFKAVCAFVQTWETKADMKSLLPEILAGVFSKNQFFINKYEVNQENN